MEKQSVLAKIREIGIVPCARVKADAQVRFAAETLCAAGIPVLEIPLTVPGAPALIEELANRFPDLVVGAGTVLDQHEARRCAEAGARFLTSPGFIPEIVAYAQQANLAVFPGALTPSEVIGAWKAGGDFIKIFPAETAGGTRFIRALRVPLPQIPLIVTGGVNQVTAFDYILSGATAIGVGTVLLPKEALENREPRQICELARRFLKMVREARRQRGEEKG